MNTVLRNTAGLCNGSTPDSDSVCEGSNPSPAAKKKSLQCNDFFFISANPINTILYFLHNQIDNILFSLILDKTHVFCYNILKDTLSMAVFSAYAEISELNGCLLFIFAPY